MKVRASVKRLCEHCKIVRRKVSFALFAPTRATKRQVRNRFMPRLLGVDIRGEKRIDVALRDIYGVGPVNSKAILRKQHRPRSPRQGFERTAIVPDRPRVQEGKYVMKAICVGNRSGPQAAAGIKCYRGVRHLRGCPCAAAHPNQRPHPQRPAQDRRRAAESEREDWHPLILFLVMAEHQVQETCCKQERNRNRSPTNDPKAPRR